MASADVLIVDYGLGNLFNVQAAFTSVGAEAVISDRAEDLKNAKRIVVPGVGAFFDGMKGLHERGLVQPIQKFAEAGKPVLGLCLGAQLLLTKSEEWGSHDGLDIVAGKVVHLKPPLPGVNYKIPHIGWNSMKRARATPMLTGLANESEPEFFMYFLHSYVTELEDKNATIATTEYGRDNFCSAFQVGNVVGFQPHPERSGEAGLQMFRNFLKLQ